MLTLICIWFLLAAFLGGTMLGSQSSGFTCKGQDIYERTCVTLFFAFVLITIVLIVRGMIVSS